MSPAVTRLGTRLGNPIDDLRREHSNMRSVLALIGRQLDLLEAETGNDLVLLLNALYYMRKFPGAVHHPKEDAIFECLAKAEPAWRGEVDKLRGQHHEIYQLEDWLMETALDQPKPSPPQRGRLVEFGRHYLDLQRQHSEFEERVLFPQALASLQKPDWAAIAARFKAVDDPLFGQHGGERFQLLYDHLLREAAGQ